ncbi:MAG: hypothetical protein M3H12_15650, partial [Chromatiales bacterium]
MEKKTKCFDAEYLHWNNLCGVLTDIAPVVLGSRSGFVTLVKRIVQRGFSSHSMIHRQAFASKTLPQALVE